MTDNQLDYEALQIGHDLGTMAVVLDAKAVAERVNVVGWENEGPASRGFAPPGVTIRFHFAMKIMALPRMHAAIWAKSEHEFLGSMRVGEKVTIRGRVVDKYTKRGRDYMVTEFETTGESGDVLLRSRETAVWVE